MFDVAAIEVPIKPKSHLIASLGLSAGLYAVHSEWLPAALALGAGTLVDLDHLFDLWFYQRHRPQGEPLMEVFDAHTWVRSYLFLHAFEWLLLLLIPLLVSQQPWPWIGLYAGYLLHMIMDIVGNRCFPLTYSLGYRIYRRFDARYLWWDSRSPGAVS